MTNSETVRRLLLDRIKLDLMGPLYGNNEILSEEIAKEGPEGEYILGKLYPKKTKHTEEVQEELTLETPRQKEGPIDSDAKINKEFNKPSSIGLSFFLKNSSPEFQLEIKLELGSYKQIEVDDEENEGKKKRVFKRTQVPEAGRELKIITIKEHDSTFTHSENFSDDVEGAKIFYKTRKWKNLIQVSLFLVNDLEVKEQYDPIDNNEKTFFQAGFRVRAHKGCNIEPLPSRAQYAKFDPLNSMLYRNRLIYAVGHTCSADWDEDALEIRTTWLPEHFIPDVNPMGSMTETYNATKISKLEQDELARKLKTLTSSYKTWIEEQGKLIIEDLQKKYRDIAEEQQKSAKSLLERMNKSIDLLENNSNLFEAFRLANKSMAKAKRWEDIDIDWRPFQLGFFLLALESTINPGSEERNVSDLLWFSTGGGKTEAYLLLMTTLLFFRKLENGGLNAKDGLAVFTRYTLRALTLDQFKRLAGTISAAEIVRTDAILGKNNGDATDNGFSVGMWVGQDGTPNTFDGARGACENPKAVEVIKNCPCCESTVSWHVDCDNKKATVTCNQDKCEIHEKLRQMPVYVVDEEIYKVIPSVIIGTVDKFVQVIRKPDKARSLFALDDDAISPPDLVIQDELHLISGPLGSITGGIEMLIDEYCKNSVGFGAKVIASTATIQRADEQILGLYGKSLAQFPVNITDADDSFFAVTKQDSPGRIYTAVTTACASSGTYMLQAVAAVLLQAIESQNIKNFSDGDKDPFTTLVCYFNNLRTLSGARVLLQDDVKMGIEGYASKRGEKPIKYDYPKELTSFAKQDEIADILTKLQRKVGEEGHITALLASVMISVGLDIPRLGMMLVNGQPKTISEYIQSTSRVGRGERPGLILTILNEFKPRDKSHYENFRNIHNNLYRHVESTSVTPFSPRARQKILPAILVALSVKRLNLWEPELGLTEQQVKIIENEIIPMILSRVEKIDPLEKSDTKLELDGYLDRWKKRGSIPYLWRDDDENNSLLMSAEARAALRAIGREQKIAFQSPNSVRSVEPSVQLRARKKVKRSELRGG